VPHPPVSARRVPQAVGVPQDRLTARLSRSEHIRALVAFAAMTGTAWDRWPR
jgi:hypothetical protein